MIGKGALIGLGGALCFTAYTKGQINSSKNDSAPAEVGKFIATVAAGSTFVVFPIVGAFAGGAYSSYNKASRPTKRNIKMLMLFSIASCSCYLLGYKRD